MSFGLINNYKTLLPPLTNEADASELLVNTQLIDSNYHVVNGTMPNRGAVNTTITNQNQVYTVPNGYHNGQGKVTANITNLTGANIKDGVTVGGVQGSFTSDGNITPEDIPTGKIGYSQGQRIVGIGGSIFDFTGIGQPEVTFNLPPSYTDFSSNTVQMDLNPYINMLLLTIIGSSEDDPSGESGSATGYINDVGVGSGNRDSCSRNFYYIRNYGQGIGLFNMNNQLFVNSENGIFTLRGNMTSPWYGYFFCYVYNQ